MYEYGTLWRAQTQFSQSSSSNTARCAEHMVQNQGSKSGSCWLSSRPYASAQRARPRRRDACTTLRCRWAQLDWRWHMREGNCWQYDLIVCLFLAYKNHSVASWEPTALSSCPPKPGVAGSVVARWTQILPPAFLLQPLTPQPYPVFMGLLAVEKLQAAKDKREDFLGLSNSGMR